MTLPVSPGFTNPGYANVDPEAGLEYCLSLIMADSSSDLTNVENEIKNNMQMKQKVRDAQAALQKYQSDLQSGNTSSLDGDKQAILDALNALGLPPDSGLVDQANKLPSSADEANKDSDARNKDLDGVVKTFQSGLQGLADSYSDLSQQYQFELQKASDIYNRTVTFTTNSMSKFSQASDGIANNVKS